MTFTGLTVAAGTAAFSAEGDEAGRDKRAVDLEILDASQELAADQSGMLGDIHGGKIANQGAGMD